MKSSYELAMERMGGGDAPLSDEQKKQIAEIDSRYKAKVAERKIFLEKSISIDRVCVSQAVSLQVTNLRQREFKPDIYKARTAHLGSRLGNPSLQLCIRNLQIQGQDYQARFPRPRCDWDDF